MGSDGGRAFYVRGWMTRAAYALGAVQLVFAAVLFGLSDVLAVGPMIPSVFVVGGLLTGYQGFWTARTPLVRFDEGGLTLRLAMLARPRSIRFADVRAFARIPPGWLLLLAGDGTETRVPLTSLSESDADAVVRELAQHLTEVSYVED